MLNSILGIAENISSLASTREGNFSLHELSSSLKKALKDKKHDNKNNKKIISLAGEIRNRSTDKDTLNNINEISGLAVDNMLE